jgi:cytochrome b subunit of formate dehydrogenase
MTDRWSPRIVLVPLSILLLATGATAQENEDCLSCHEVEGLSFERDGRAVSIHVDAERFGASVHEKLSCVSCHTDLDGVEEWPHERDLPRVDCTECHDDSDGPVTEYWSSTHGRLAEEGNPLAPLCQDCHGDHYVLELEHPDSAISPFNVPGMCAQCHAEDAPVARAYDLPQEHIFERYRQSIHGEGLYKQGLSVTAVCTSCHTGHSVLPHTDPRSTIHKDNVVATCMACHGRIEDVHRKVIKGELWEEAGVVPLCVECHSPHEARRVFYDTNMANADCMRCHERPDIVASADRRSLLVDLAEHEGSIHGREGVSCSQCHTGVTASLERPCETVTDSVSCEVCHEDQVVRYERGVHGSLRATGDKNAPSCVDCHGDHEILESEPAPDAPPELKAAIRLSPTFSRNVPSLCGTCHAEGAPAAKRILGGQGDIVEHYSMSIHGKGLIESGLTVTAVCSDCHTAHMELPPSDPDSSVSDLNIPETCGACHDGIYESYQLSVHSVAGNPDYEQLRGMPKLPLCNDCHSSHAMTRTDLPDFQLGIMEQCGKCHEEITHTYFETYHGKASALGDTTKAKCYDCHGAHEVRPKEDPLSTLHADNIVGTCAQCHPGANKSFTGYLTHASHRDRENYPQLWWPFILMTSLLVGVFAFFGLHTAIWFPRSWKLRKQHKAELAAIPARERQYQRFTPFQRGLHLTVILSFFGLAITGMMLKFSYTGWAQGLSRAMGGPAVAGWVHRVCAIATFAYMGLHLIDVWGKYRRSGNKPLAFLFGKDSMMPRWADVREFGQTLRWFVGKGPMPRYGKWTYWEKFDYLAVFWGVAIIGVTGLFLWFPVLFTKVLPGWAINVATIIHSDEALLATGFIFTIHFFNTHFRPEKFPLDPVIFTGRMTVNELKHDRPALYDELVASGELEKHLVEPAPAGFTRVAKAFGFTALFVGIALIVLIVYTLVFM